MREAHGAYTEKISERKIYYMFSHSVYTIFILYYYDLTHTFHFPWMMQNMFLSLSSFLTTFTSTVFFNIFWKNEKPFSSAFYVSLLPAYARNRKLELHQKRLELLQLNAQFNRIRLLLFGVFSLRLAARLYRNAPHNLSIYPSFMRFVTIAAHTRSTQSHITNNFAFKATSVSGIH